MTINELDCVRRLDEKITDKINKIIQKWIESLLDQELQEDLYNQWIVAGGAITSLLNGEEPKDYDLYLSSSQLAYRVKAYYKKHPTQSVIITGNAVTVPDKVQIVTRVFGTPQEVIDTFDFLHTRHYYSPVEGLVYSPGSLRASISKQLIFTGSKNCVSAVHRVAKFVGRGWKINKEELNKILHAVRTMPEVDFASQLKKESHDS